MQAVKKYPTALVQPAWQLHTAKARFSEVFRLARSEGPQEITKQGTEAVIVIPKEEFERLCQKPSKKMGLGEFFLKSPLKKSGLQLVRTLDYGRKINL